MICKLFDELSHPEKINLIGKVVHALQSDDLCFLEACQIVTHAQQKGLFNGVEILPEDKNDQPLIA